MAAAGSSNEVEDQPEYACVIPKADRVSDAEHHDREEETPMTEKGDSLVYADLDLNPVPENEARKSMTARFEPTEYVSIDFTKTGTVKMDEDGNN